jgi:MYXO-CTERM domain-containing protein
MRRAVITLILTAAVAALALLATPRRAEACGGCLSPVEAVTTVDSHRMVVALGVEETVLWDQIIYSGDPEDFVWVLPVTGPEVSVELADPAFFDWIDSASSPTVQPVNPVQTFCGSSTSGFGCGSTSAGADDGGGPSDKVTVSNRETVGPYETVTITSEDPMALYEWLQENGYQVTEDARPAIDDYVDAGFSFVALRLAPGEGVSAMQPIRVRYPSFMGTFPLKMVVVGARGVLNLSLWVIAEQRYEVFNYGTVEIDAADLQWNWDTNTSNYNEVFEQTAAESGNRAWIAEYATRLSELGWGAVYEPAPTEAAEDLALANSLVTNAFITRLRTQVLTDHVDEDMVLAPAADSSELFGTLFAEREINRPAEPNCSSGFNGGSDDGGVACRSGNTHKAGGSMLLLLGAIAFGWRRRRPRVTRT